MSGSPAGALSALDWKSIGWTLLTAAAAAILTAILDSVLPDLKEKGLIDAGIFTLLTTFLHAVRKFLTDTRLPPKVVVLLVAGLSLLCSSAGAVDLIDLGDVQDGKHRYEVVIKDGKIVSVLPLAVFKVGQTPTTPPTNPNPPVNPSAFAKEVQLQAKAALDAGGSKTTGAALSSVYSLVSDGVADGSVSTEKVWDALRQATDLLLATQPDGAKWVQFRTDLRNGNQLDTKDKIAAVLKDVSVGINLATGFNAEPKQLAKVDPRTAGILEGIDIGRLIELIKLVMELIKLFK
jgi:hypothetical protein